jgi:hypothetical protein
MSDTEEVEVAERAAHAEEILDDFRIRYNIYQICSSQPIPGALEGW